MAETDKDKMCHFVAEGVKLDGNSLIHLFIFIYTLSSCIKGIVESWKYVGLSGNSCPQYQADGKVLPTYVKLHATMLHTGDSASCLFHFSHLVYKHFGYSWKMCFNASLILDIL